MCEDDEMHGYTQKVDGRGSCWADKERRQATKCMMEGSGRTGEVVWQLHITSGADGKAMGRDTDANNVLFVEGLMASRLSCVVV